MRYKTVLFCITLLIFSLSSLLAQTVNTGFGMSSNRTTDYFVSATDLYNGWGLYFSNHRNSYDKGLNSGNDLSGIADRTSRFRGILEDDHYETYSGISAGVNCRLTESGSKFPTHVYMGIGNYDKAEFRQYGILYEFNSNRESYQRYEWVKETNYKIFFAEWLVSVDFPLSEHLYFSTVTGFNTSCWWLGYLCVTFKFDD